MGIDLRGLKEWIQPFLEYHRKVETAPRWTCIECQFESNQYDVSHHRECSKYTGLVEKQTLKNPTERNSE